MCAAVPAPFAHELRVRFGECDPQGIVFNANYLLYFDVAITELWREAGCPWQELVERGVEAVVAETNIRFLAPAVFDDVIELQATVAQVGTTSITTEIDAVRDGDPLVRGTLRHVCIDTRTREKTPVPEWLRESLGRYSAEQLV